MNGADLWLLILSLIRLQIQFNLNCFWIKRHLWQKCNEISDKNQRIQNV